MNGVSLILRERGSLTQLVLFEDRTGKRWSCSRDGLWTPDAGVITLVSEVNFGEPVTAGEEVKT